MLKVILNRIKTQADVIIAEEQAGLRPEGAQQIRSSTLESFVKSIANSSRIFTRSSLILRKHLEEYGMQPYGPACGSTLSIFFFHYVL